MIWAVLQIQLSFKWGEHLNLTLKGVPLRILLTISHQPRPWNAFLGVFCQHQHPLIILHATKCFYYYRSENSNAGAKANSPVPGRGFTWSPLSALDPSPPLTTPGAFLPTCTSWGRETSIYKRPTVNKSQCCILSVFQSLLILQTSLGSGHN